MPQKHKYGLKPLPYTQTESLGSRISRLRKQNGLTQAQLADKIGIDKTLVSSYERDKLHINDEVIIRIALALKVSTDVLLGVKKQKEQAPLASLRFLKRLIIIETFPEAHKKRILRNLDDAIEAYKK